MPASCSTGWTGGIARVLADKARLDADEAFTRAGDLLDAYANSLYRSVKNARDGQPLAARLDAADSVGFLLELLFTLDRRPRPYNKYLRWELDRYPLPGWDTGGLLGAVDRIAATGDVRAQQRLFARVEAAVRGPGSARSSTHGGRSRPHASGTTVTLAPRPDVRAPSGASATGAPGRRRSGGRAGRPGAVRRTGPGGPSRPSTGRG